MVAVCGRLDVRLYTHSLFIHTKSPTLRGDSDKEQKRKKKTPLSTKPPPTLRPTSIQHTTCPSSHTPLCFSWCNHTVLPLAISCSHCILVGVFGDFLGCRGVWGAGWELLCVSVKEKERMEVRVSGVLVEGRGERERD